MKVIGGFLKGRNLRVLKTGILRPTKSIVREAVFDILGDRIQGARVLELFAGTGALGIESVSRSAAQVVMVERDLALFKVLGENVRRLDIASRVFLKNDPAETALRAFAREKKKFDIVFADPPYTYDARSLVKLLRLIFEVVPATGMVLLEVSLHTLLPKTGTNWLLVKERTYGSAKLLIYQAKGADSNIPG
jgi:16S rRNA (guanine966-N2)-methyltransferase